MFESDGRAKGFALNVLSNVGGSLVISTAVALWEHLRHQSVDWWGILGLFVVACIVFFFVVRLKSKPTNEELIGSQIRKPAWQKLQWANAERNRLEGEVERLKQTKTKQEESAPRPIDSLLSPLQIEILQLSKDLHTLLRDAGQPPELKNTGPMKKGEDQKQWSEERLAESIAWTAERAEWERKFIYSYKEHFAARVKKLRNDLGKTGRVVVSLDPYTDNIHNSTGDFEELIDILMDFFMQLENPKVKSLNKVQVEPTRDMTSLLFKPIQLEILQFVRELRSFLKEMGEKTRARAEDFDTSTADGVAEYLQADLVLQDPWNTKFRSLYDKHYSQRLQGIVNDLGIHGLKRGFLSGCANGGIKDATEGQLLIETLVSAAFQLDEIYVFPRNVYSEKEISMMCENEIRDKIATEPGFLVSYEQYMLAHASKGKKP